MLAFIKAKTYTTLDWSHNSDDILSLNILLQMNVQTVVTFHYAPWVETPPHSLSLGLHHGVAANHSKWDAVL